MKVTGLDWRGNIMQAIKEHRKVKSRKISINLPAEVEGKEMEILIFPFESKKKKRSLQSLLLSGRTFSSGEIASVKKVIERSNKWKIRQY